MAKPKTRICNRFDFDWGGGGLRVHVLFWSSFKLELLFKSGHFICSNGLKIVELFRKDVHPQKGFKGKISVYLSLRLLWHLFVKPLLYPKTLL